MSAADPTGALCTYLAGTNVASVVAADSSVTGGRAIYRPKLPGPGSLPQAMPFACVVVYRGGGYALTGGSLQPVGDPRVQFLCYGQHALEAQAIGAEVVGALRALRQKVVEGVRFYWARIEGGPLPLTDPDENWPETLVVAQVAHCEVALA